MDRFIDLFKEQLDVVCEVEVNETTVFRDLEEWSSLVALSVIAMIDEEYGVSISGNDMRRVNTVGELYNLIKARL